MSDPTNAGSAAEGTGTPTPTSQTPSEPSAEFKGLQTKVNQKDNVIKAHERTIEELSAKVRELEPKPSVEEELARERAARQQLEKQIQIEKLKAANPEVADVIDVLATGATLEEAVAAIKPKINAPAANTESSGLRNNPARQAPSLSDEMESILKNGKAF